MNERLLYRMQNINLVIDNTIPALVIDAVIDGINIAMKNMFETGARIHITRIEDYNLTPLEIVGVHTLKRMYMPIFNCLYTNVYISSLSSIPSKKGETLLGTSDRAYACRPPARMIDLFVPSITPGCAFPKSCIEHVTAHEMMHLHPLYMYDHCKNTECLMAPELDKSHPQTYALCPECTKKLQQFNSDPKFQRKIVNQTRNREIRIQNISTIRAYSRCLFTREMLFWRMGKAHFNIIHNIKVYFAGWLPNQK